MNLIIQREYTFSMHIALLHNSKFAEANIAMNALWRYNRVNCITFRPFAYFSSQCLNCCQTNRRNTTQAKAAFYQPRKLSFLSNELDADQLHECNASHVHPTGIWRKHSNNHTAHLVPVVRSEVRVLSREGRVLTGENENVTAGSIDLHDDEPMKSIRLEATRNDCSPDWPLWCVS